MYGVQACYGVCGYGAMACVGVGVRCAGVCGYGVRCYGVGCTYGVRMVYMSCGVRMVYVVYIVL